VVNPFVSIRGDLNQSTALPQRGGPFFFGVDRLGNIFTPIRQYPVETSGMTAAHLARSAASDASPPAGLSAAACALWFARAGKWDAAHDLCQDVPGMAGSWIHAYLHREEGDLSNAAYWYARAGKIMPAATFPLPDEWMEIASELVA
jgi:hypothetical protein